MSKSEFVISRAVGRGDWHKVIELERGALKTEEHKEFNYSMIGYAYEQLKEFEKAKENYVIAMDIDAFFGQPIEGMARVHAEEEKYELAYEYVLRGLYKTKNNGFQVPKLVKLFLSVVLKIMGPSKSFSQARKETERMDQYRNEWVKWAIEYKEWYESNLLEKKE